MSARIFCNHTGIQTLDECLSFGPVVGGCPASELRQHLSERAPTDAGNHVNIHVNVITNGAV